MIRVSRTADIDQIHRIINDAAAVYQGVIPDGSWHQPYMPRDELEAEILAGVIFWVLEREGRLLGVMGIQDRDDVTLIRHAYVDPDAQQGGVGTALLRHLEALADKPILIGTWAAASWAIAFYRKRGYRVVSEAEKTRLLRRYWTVPESQIAASVVLAKADRQ